MKRAEGMVKIRNLVKLAGAIAVAAVLSGGNAFAFFWGHNGGGFGNFGNQSFGNQNQGAPFLGRFLGRLTGKTDIQELTKEASAGRLKVAVQKNNDDSGEYCGFYGTGRDGFTPTIRIVPCNGDKKIGSNWFCPIGKTMVAIAQADKWGHDGKNHHVTFTCVDTPSGVQDPTPDGRRVILNWHGWKIAYGPKDTWTGISPQYATANSVKQDVQGLTNKINSINDELYALASKVNTNTNNIVYNRERINELQNQMDNLKTEKNQITIQVSQEYNADAPRHKRRTLDMGYHKVCFLTAASPWGDDGNDCHLYTDRAPDGKTKVHWWITAWNEDDPIVRCRARCLDW